MYFLSFLVVMKIHGWFTVLGGAYSTSGDKTINPASFVRVSVVFGEKVRSGFYVGNMIELG